MDSLIDRRTRFRQFLTISLFVILTPYWAYADEHQAKNKSVGAEFWSALTAGKPILDVNFRYGYAKLNANQHSHSATARTRLGYQSGEFYGISGLVEMVNTISPKPSAFFDGVENNDGPQSIVADPARTDVNRAWLQYSKPEWGALKVKGGRQRIKLDDDRWIGNVGWRQNEQTYDAARVSTNLGIEKLLIQYIYAWQVNRIFGDQGPANRRDFGPRSHFANIAYNHSSALKAVAFAYFIDPNDPTFRGLGSQTYGVRFNGKIPVNDKFIVPYQVSYAFQEDGGNNQTSYDAHYAYVEGGLGWKGIGTISGGFELLGSDTDAVVVTPFSTAHKFNGFADTFLNNGGPRGLRDVFASIAPAIPIAGFKFKFIFHQFWDDQGGDNLGQEYDIVSTYKVNQYLSFLYKFAYFDGGKTRSPATRTRSTIQATVKF